MLVIQFNPGEKFIKRKKGFMYDTGQIISLLGLSELSPTPVVSFYANEIEESRLGEFSEGVLICDVPNIFFEHKVFGIAVKNVTETSTTTEYAVILTLSEQGKPTTTVTQDQQSIIDQLVAQLQGLIVSVGEINETASGSASEAAASASAAAQSENNAA